MLGFAIVEIMQEVERQIMKGKVKMTHEIGNTYQARIPAESNHLVTVQFTKASAVSEEYDMYQVVSLEVDYLSGKTFSRCNLVFLDEVGGSMNSMTEEMQATPKYVRLIDLEEVARLVKERGIARVYEYKPVVDFDSLSSTEKEKREIKVRIFDVEEINGHVCLVIPGDLT